MIFADTVTRVRAAAQTDPYGNPSSTRDWAHATRTAMTGVSLQPDAGSDTSTENTGDRTYVITGWRLLSKPGTDLDLSPTDRVELYDGVVAEVDGEIARWRLGGKVHHVEARLKRVGG